MITDARIAKGGRLLATRWEEGKEEYKKLSADLTNYAPNWLFLPCTIDDDVVLRDIYLLLEKHKSIFTDLISDYVPGIVQEGLSPYVGKKGPLSVALLSFEIEYSPIDADMRLSGNTLPVLHVLGSSEEERYDAGVYPADELAELPLKLSKKLSIFRDDPKQNEVFENPEYSLWQILCAIVHELSWYGSPNERDGWLQKMKEQHGELGGDRR